MLWPRLKQTQNNAHNDDHYCSGDINAHGSGNSNDNSDNNSNNNSDNAARLLGRQAGKQTCM
jgi:hypothetical protein